MKGYENNFYLCPDTHVNSNAIRVHVTLCTHLFPTLYFETIQFSTFLDLHTSIHRYQYLVAACQTNLSKYSLRQGPTAPSLLALELVTFNGRCSLCLACD